MALYKFVLIDYKHWLLGHVGICRDTKTGAISL